MPKCSCGRNFDTKRGLSVHRASKHGDKNIQSVKCDNCGNTMEKKSSKVNETNFCDPSCMGEFQSKSGTKVIECDYCENSFTKRKSMIARSEKDFCGDQCQANWRSENLTGDKNYNYIDTSNMCEWCEEEYHVKKNEQEESRFCCLKHMHLWRSENESGENSHLWKGGRYGYRGDTWQKWKREIRERDGNICQNCGKSENSGNLDVHHIVPVRDFDDPNMAHFEENLYQLCTSCHPTFEKMSAIKQKRKLED